MDRDRRVRLYDAHSWVGISLGLFLFVVCFTGSLAMFHNELLSWEDPARRLPISSEPVSVDQLTRDWASKYPATEIDFVSVFYPSKREPYFLGRLNHEPSDGERTFLERRWHTATGAVLPERGDGLATWILDFHRDLMWPAAIGGRQIGRAIVGIAGIIMLLSIVTGIVTHRKILREIFTLRNRRSIRVKWKDSHNVLGTWTLPFSIVMAFTGAWLGVVVLLLPLTGVLVFKGDTEKVIQVVAPPGEGRTGTAADGLSFDELADRPHSKTGAKLAGVFVSNWGDAAAVYTLNYLPLDTLRYFEVENLNVQGELLPLDGLNEPMVATRVLAAISPLHYGTYGGLALKYLYFVLGVALSVMIAMGNMVWIERRWHTSEGQRSPAFYRRLSNMTVGVCMGVVVASTAIFYADGLYSGPEPGRIAYVGWIYFASWALIIALTFFINDGYKSMRRWMALVGMGLLGIPFFDTWVSASAPWTLLNHGHVAAPTVSLTLVILGLISLCAARVLPRERLERNGRNRSTAYTDLGAPPKTN